MRAKDRSGRSASIREVADLAGVGIASVSRVLSGQPGSSEALAARVLDAARQLGYTPNVLAQGLRRRSTRSIGFVFSDITNPLVASIVSGAEGVFSLAGYSLLLTDSGGASAVDAQRIEVLRQRQVDGLIVLPASENDAATLTAMRTLATPIVAIDRSLPDDVNAHYVLSDHYSGMGEAARRLLQDGHRTLGLAVGPDVRPSRERIRAVRDAYRALGLEEDLLVDPGPLCAEHGASAMRRFLEGPRPCSAVVLGGNQLLEGALGVVRERGLRLGEDVSLVSCDDLPLNRLFEPPVATVMRDMSLIGKSAGEMLLAQIEEPHPSSPVVLPTWFELRGSCRPRAVQR